MTLTTKTGATQAPAVDHATARLRRAAKPTRPNPASIMA